MDEPTRLSTTEIAALVAEYPQLPIVYLNYLREIGWGESPSGHRIYSGPISPDEVYPQLSADQHRVLLGDDMQGFCLGYDFASQKFGEYSDAGEWSNFGEDFDLEALLRNDFA